MVAPPGDPAPEREERRDWTVDPETGRSNSSPEFLNLVSITEQLIRGEAASLIAGRADRAAVLIMAQLAHRYGLIPEQDAERLRQQAESQLAEARAELKRLSTVERELAAVDDALPEWEPEPGGMAVGRVQTIENLIVDRATLRELRSDQAVERATRAASKWNGGNFAWSWWLDAVRTVRDALLEGADL